MKKILYIFLLLSASLMFAGNYPDILNFSPANGSFQVEYAPRLIISFTVTNSPSGNLAIYVGGEMVVTMLPVGSYTAGKVNTNSGFKCAEGYDSNQDLTTWSVQGAGPYYYYASLTNFSWFQLQSGQKIDVAVITSSNSADNGKYQTNTFWFVLKDTTPPTIAFLDKNDNSFDDTQSYPYLVSVKILGHDNSEEDVICYYTLDGSDPTTHSACFTNLKILNLGQSAIIKVLAKDLSGNFSLVESKTINVESVTHANVNIKLYSQIIENNNLKIYFPEKDRYTIKIYDIQGNQIYQKEKEFGPDNDFIGISENLNLPHGIFIVKIVDSKNKTKTFRIAVK